MDPRIRTLSHRGGLPIATFFGCLILGWIASKNPTIVEFDIEESMNAAQAVALLDGHLGIDFFRLQYASFCGGCSVDAALGALMFSVFEPSWFAWKSVAVFTYAGFAAAGVGWMRRSHGMPAAITLAVLLMFPSKLGLSLSLVALGNHQEAGMLAALGLLALAGSRTARSTFIAGMVLGFGMFVGWSAAPMAGASLAWLALRKAFQRLGVLIGGMALGLGPGLLLRIYVEQNFPIRKIYAHAFIPKLGNIPEKMGDLFTLGLPAALYGWSSDIGLWVGLFWSFMVLICGVRAVRRKSGLGVLLLLGISAWVLAYSLVDFRIEEINWRYTGTPFGLRYLAPLLPLTALLLATEVGDLWQRKQYRVASLILLPALLSGFHARERSFAFPERVVQLDQMYPADPELEREVFRERLSVDEHLKCDTGSTRHRALHAWAMAARAVREALDGQSRRPNPPAELVPPSGYPAESWWGGLASTLAEQAGPSPESPKWHIARLEHWIQDAPTALKPSIRREFWWSWIRSFPSETTVSLADIDHPALHWAEGRRAGQESASWALPRPEAIQNAVLHWVGTNKLGNDDWAAGFGYGVGEHWGVAGRDIPYIQDHSAMADGYDKGTAYRWIVP